MTRLLFWLALAFLVTAAIRSKLRGGRTPPRPSGAPEAPPRRARAAQQGEAETMLCCAHCGVYCPASETVSARGHDYCSAAHAAAAAP